jgi:hypothetical protein
MNKVFWKSKSNLFGFITAITGALSLAIPALSNVQPFMTKNEAALAMAWGILGMILRSVKSNIVLTE